MSIARTLFKLGQYQVSSVTTAPYSHPGMTGSTVGAALDWLFAVAYPNALSSVATPGDLPLVGNTLNDYRIVVDDGDGKAAGYRWEQREGEASPSWHKTHDMDWSSDAILSAFMDITQDLYVHKSGRSDLDDTGNPITGLYAGQTIYGGSSAGENLTLNANSGDGTGAQSGHVQFDGNTRPTNDNAYDLGTITERFRNLLIAGYLGDGTVTITVAEAKTAYDHSQIVTGNPHNTGYDDLSNQLGTLTLDGDVSGSADLSTSGNKTLTVTVANDSHTHDALSTINNFDTAVYEELKLQLVDNGPLTWVFDDGLEEVTPTFDINSDDIGDIASPAANKILVSNAAGTDWVQSNGEIELTGDVTGTANYNSSTDKWSISTTVQFSSVATLTDVDLEVKTFTSVAGNPTVVTATAHGLRNGEEATFYGTLLNDTYAITYIDANSFSVAVNTAGADSGYYLPNGAQLLWNPITKKFEAAKEYEEIRLGELDGLSEDVLTQYVAKDGRSGGQTIQGGVSASEALILESTAHATKGTIQLKDDTTPFDDAAYSGGWSGVDLGSASRRFNDLYMAGEAKGFRAENVGALPTPSGTEIGRQVFYSGNLWICDGSEYIKVGSSDVAVSSVSSNHTVTDEDVILASNTITITLPAAASFTKRLVIKNTGTGTITIDGNGSETIDGSLTYDIFDQYHTANLVSNGTGWFLT